MRFSYLTAAVLALASSGCAQEFFDSITSPTRDQVLPAGKPFDIIWAPEKVEGTIKITLLEGKTNITLIPGPIIASGVDNQLGKFTWTPEDRGAETYGFRIDHETNTTLFQYSQPFHIEGSGAQTTTIKLSTGPSYTSTSTTTSSIPSSTVTVVSTSTSANLSTSKTAAPSTSSIIVPSSNLTLVTSATTAPSNTQTTPTTSSTPIVTPNAAVAKVASGGLAIVGGLVLALAL